jgi:hypothetical protein
MDKSIRWSKNEEQRLINWMNSKLTSGMTVIEALESFPNDIKRSVNSVRLKWYNLQKKMKKNEQKIQDEKETFCTFNSQQEQAKETKQNKLNYEQTKIEFNDLSTYETIVDKISMLIEENKLLKEQNQKLTKENNELKDAYSNLNEDQKMILQVIEKARKMHVENEIGINSSKPLFKMDRNGNIERV